MRLPFLDVNRVTSGKLPLIEASLTEDVYVADQITQSTGIVNFLLEAKADLGARCPAYSLLPANAAVCLRVGFSVSLFYFLVVTFSHSMV